MRLEQAIVTLNSRQMAGAEGSHIADIDPRAMLVVTLLYLAALLSVPVTLPGMLIWFAVYPIVTAPLAHVAYERIFMQSLYILPLLLVIAVFNPIYDRATSFTVGNVAISRGWLSFTAILIRGLLSLQALLLLIRVCGFNRICDALSALRVPRVFVTQLLMVYRYLTVLLQEAMTMHRARLARGYGRTSYGASMWGPFVGQLMLRSIERARRINMAMKARGFNGLLPVSGAGRWTTSDTVYCFVWIAAIAVLRFCDLSALLLKLIN